MIEARRADTDSCRTFGARMLSMLAGIHGLTAVAINLRPFRPHIRRALDDSSAYASLKYFF